MTWGRRWTIKAFTDISGYTAGKAISIKYNATVNKDAEISGTPNTNTADLTYSNNPNTDYDGTMNPDKPGLPDESKTTPTGTTPKYETRTYVTELKLTRSIALPSRRCRSQSSH